MYLIRAVAISPDSRWLVTSSEDDTARRWDLREKSVCQPGGILREHEANVSGSRSARITAGLSPAALTTTARLWALSAKDPFANPVVLRGHEGRVSAVAISPDNRWLVTGSADNHGAALGSESERPRC